MENENPIKTPMRTWRVVVREGHFTQENRDSDSLEVQPILKMMCRKSNLRIDDADGRVGPEPVPVRIRPALARRRAFRFSTQHQDNTRRCPGSLESLNYEIPFLFNSSSV
jgi:hypothetical protein